MKKLLKILASLVVLLVVVVALVVVFWLGPAVKTAVETIGPKAIGAPVRIESLRIYPLRGTLSMHGLFIGNPRGFSNPSAVELKSFKLSVDLASLSSDTIVVKEILIDQPVFTYERQLRTDNFKAIQNNVEAYIGQQKGAETGKASEQEKAPSEKPAKKVVIERLVVKDGEVRAKLSALPTAPIPLPDIEKTNIGKDKGGTSYADAATEVVSTIYDSILKAIASIGDLGVDAVKGVGKTATDAGKAVGDTAGEAVKSIGNLFKKK